MNPDNIQDLVNIAFCLEAISDKNECTTRYHDIPGKPLKDFLISGINVSKYFRKLAKDISNSKNPHIFKYFVTALSNSNSYKSDKTLNFGLLEIMFPTVYARMICNQSNNAIDTIVEIMKKTSKEDAQYLIDARLEAWKTSNNKIKQNFNGENFESNSPYEFYMKLIQTYDNTSASYQWSQEYKNNLPIMREFYNSFTSKENLLEDIKKTYNKIKKNKPKIKKGIIADMCAAAIFLFLSYLKHEYKQ